MNDGEPFIRLQEYQLSVSKRGLVHIKYGGYTYAQHSRKNVSMEYRNKNFRCLNHWKKCRAKGEVDNFSNFRIKCEHNHPPNL